MLLCCYGIMADVVYKSVPVAIKRIQLSLLPLFPAASEVLFPFCAKGKIPIIYILQFS